MTRTGPRHRRRRLGADRIRALLGGAFVFVLGACGDGGTDGATADAHGAPVYGGTLVIASPTDLDGANTLVTGEARTQELIRSALYTTLIRVGPHFEYEPYLAESWELLGDTGVVFRLRDDVRWHDGEPTTAFDVAFTFARATVPETGFANSSFFAHWTEFEVVDSFTIRFGFEPHADPLGGWPFVPIMPEHLLEHVPASELHHAEFNRNPVGNGPFRFVSQQPNDRWIFEANPDFPEALGGRPYLDRVVWRVIPENTAQVAELRTGTVDLILSPRTAQAAQLDARPDLRVIVRPTRKYQLIAWNGKRRPLDDARVRRALTLAIDREEMRVAPSLRAGFAELAVGPIDPSNWAFHHGLEPLPHDVDAARGLLAEAGWADRDGDGIVEDEAGTELRIELTIPANNQYNRNVAEKVQADLREVGVDLEIRTHDFATLIANVTSPERRFDAVFLAWQADYRPSTLRDLFHSDAIDGPFQLASYAHPEVDRLIDEASRIVSREAARPLWYRVQEILHREQPWTFVYYTPDVYAINERVRGVEMDVRDAFRSLPRWWKAGRGEQVVAAAVR